MRKILTEQIVWNVSNDSELAYKRIMQRSAFQDLQGTYNTASQFVWTSVRSGGLLNVAVFYWTSFHFYSDHALMIPTWGLASIFFQIIDEK